MSQWSLATTALRVHLLVCCSYLLVCCSLARHHSLACLSLLTCLLAACVQLSQASSVAGGWKTSATGVCPASCGGVTGFPLTTSPWRERTPKQPALSMSRWTGPVQLPPHFYFFHLQCALTCLPCLPCLDCLCRLSAYVEQCCDAILGVFYLLSTFRLVFVTHKAPFCSVRLCMCGGGGALRGAVCRYQQP